MQFENGIVSVSVQYNKIYLHEHNTSAFNGHRDYILMPLFKPQKREIIIM